MKIFRSILNLFNKTRLYLRSHAQKKHEALILKGIRSSRKAYTGPSTLELDLTDQCLNTCLACWVHSPLLKIKKVHKKFIPYDALTRWVNEFHQLGVQEIKLAGAGDPLNHPRIKEILILLKAKGFKVVLNTSLFPLPENFADFLTRIRLDELTLSLWAGNSKEWSRLHPGIAEKHFDKISDFLTELEHYKQIKKTEYPRIKIYNVITALNADNLQGMLHYALTHFADRMEFQMADIFPDIQDLELKSSHIQKIKDQIPSLYSVAGYTDEFIGQGNRISLSEPLGSQEQKEFGRFYHPLKQGFLWKSITEILCPKGLNYFRKSWIHDHPYPAFHFEYDTNICSQCTHAPQCYPEPHSVPLTVRFTNLTGLGTFLRRIESRGSSGQEKDQSAVFNTPCLAPWHYGRIVSDGQFIPCCKASKMPMGNLYHESFKKIWFGRQMNEFRFKAFRIADHYPYFSTIQCIKGCDNLGENLNWNKKAFSLPEK